MEMKSDTSIYGFPSSKTRKETMIFRKHCSNVAVLKAVCGVSSAPHPHPCMFKSSGDSKVACPPSVPYIQYIVKMTRLWSVSCFPYWRSTTVQFSKKNLLFWTWPCFPDENLNINKEKTKTVQTRVSDLQLVMPGLISLWWRATAAPAALGLSPLTGFCCCRNVLTVHHAHPGGW